jgi:hypothetical protein
VLCDQWPIINTFHIFMVTKQIYVYSGFDVALCFSFHIHNHVKNVFKNVFLQCVWHQCYDGENWSSNKKGQKILHFIQLWVKPKSRNLYLPDWKPNTMLSFYDSTSYNYSSNGNSGATFISTLPIKKSFLFFLYLWSVYKNRQ